MSASLRFLKPFDGGGWKNVSKVNSLEELWKEYDQTGTLCMTLQEGIDFDQFVRCYCVGQEEVMIMAYDPRKPYLSGEQYIHNPDYLAPELAARVESRRSHAVHRAWIRSEHGRVCDQGRHSLRDRFHESGA